MTGGKPSSHYNRQFLEFLKVCYVAAFVSLVKIFPILLVVPSNKTPSIPHLINIFLVCSLISERNQSSPVVV
jgi:hypothetical protein